MAKIDDLLTHVTIRACDSSLGAPTDDIENSRAQPLTGIAGAEFFFVAVKEEILGDRPEGEVVPHTSLQVPIVGPLATLGRQACIVHDLDERIRSSEQGRFARPNHGSREGRARPLAEDAVRTESVLAGLFLDLDNCSYGFEISQHAVRLCRSLFPIPDMPINIWFLLFPSPQSGDQRKPNGVISRTESISAIHRWSLFMAGSDTAGVPEIQATLFPFSAQPYTWSRRGPPPGLLFQPSREFAVRRSGSSRSPISTLPSLRASHGPSGTRGSTHVQLMSAFTTVRLPVSSEIVTAPTIWRRIAVAPGKVDKSLSICARGACSLR